MSRSRWAIVVGIVSVAILAPTFLSLLTAGALTEEAGTDEFYGAVVGVLSALVVAYALQFQMFLTGFTGS